MVGIIVTGHGRFASGLTSSIDLIAGPQEHYVAVDFEHEVDQLTADLTKAIESLSDCDGVLVFADLAGGSPFKTAVLVSQAYQNIEIVAGTNLPMLAEIVMARQFGMDLESLVNSAVNTGKDQIIRFEMASVEVAEENDDFSDGI
ncbi:MAG: PTS galactosamine/N-acetylgalactosamine transporter subunit IIA [Floccifex sp.]